MSGPGGGRDAPQAAQSAAGSFWRSMRMVAWGLLGVRKNSEYQADLARVNPIHVIVAGVVAVLVLVLVLVGLVNWVVASSPAA